MEYNEKQKIKGLIEECIEDLIEHRADMERCVNNIFYITVESKEQ